MSADTEPTDGHDPSAEIPGIHDRLRRAFEASQEEDWDAFVEILNGAKSEGLKRNANLVRGGGDGE